MMKENEELDDGMKIESFDHLLISDFDTDEIIEQRNGKVKENISNEQ